jgi:hypothetical protein
MEDYWIGRIERPSEYRDNVSKKYFVCTKYKYGNKIYAIIILVRMYSGILHSVVPWYHGTSIYSSVQ